MAFLFNEFQAKFSYWWLRYLMWNSQRWLAVDLTEDKSLLVQASTWDHHATSHYVNQDWLRPLGRIELMTSYKNEEITREISRNCINIFEIYVPCHHDNGKTACLLRTHKTTNAKHFQFARYTNHVPFELTCYIIFGHVSYPRYSLNA